MRKLLLLALVAPSLLCAQIQFEKGYFIDNAGSRTPCLIRNADWKNNPESFDYRLTEAGEIQTAEIGAIAEFTIEGAATYRRFTIDLDQSTDDPSMLDFDSQPRFEQRQVFLKALVSGRATLYKYEAPEGVHFFYAREGEAVQPLVYKKYRRDGSMEIFENSAFRQTLWNELQCDGLNRASFGRLAYKEGDLADVFVRYNKCHDPNYTQKYQKEDHLLFNLTIRSGINISSGKLNVQSTSFPNAVTPRFGAEFEMVLPFNKNKWSLLLEPTFRTYKADGESSSPGLYTGYAIDYNSIEFAIGIRHYFFVSQKASLFLSAYMLNDMELDATIGRPNTVFPDYEINPLSNPAVGIGFEYDKKWSVEFRYDDERELLRYNFSDARYNNISIILGYTIL